MSVASVSGTLSLALWITHSGGNHLLYVSRLSVESASVTELGNGSSEASKTAPGGNLKVALSYVKP